MSAPRFVRGTKSRLFIYIVTVTIIGVVIYMFHDSQVELDEVRKKSEKCLQQQESLSAQLQVIFEYKLRLEKSLQQEKADHRQTREELQTRADEEKQLREKENLESINKYTSLQQQYKLLQSQHEDLNDECSKLRVTQLQGLEERSKLESAVQAVHQELEQLQAAKKKEMESFKSRFLRLEDENEKLLEKNKVLSSHTQDTASQINHLEKENRQLKAELGDLKKSLRQCESKLDGPVELRPPEGVESPVVEVDKKKTQVLQKPSSSPVAVIPEDVNLPALQEPDRKSSSDKALQSSQKSTTPQINPDAVMSHEKTANVVPVPPPQEQIDKQQPLASPVRAKQIEKENETHQQIRESQDGNEEAAVPAPHWDTNNVIPNQPAFNAINGGLIDNPNNWNNEHQRFNVPAGVVPAPQGYSFHNAENVMHPPEHENAVNNVGNQENIWPWRFKHWGPPPQPREQLHQNLRIAEEENDDGDNPMNQHHDNIALRREQRHNGQDLPRDTQRRRQLAEPHRNAIALHEDNHIGEEEKEIPRQLHNPYEYNGEYEKDRQRGDLQLEEGEEDEDDDMDQIDYANEGANAAARPKHLNIKQPLLNVNKHDSVMVNPK